MKSITLLTLVFVVASLVVAFLSYAITASIVHSKAEKQWRTKESLLKHNFALEEESLQQRK